MSANGKKERQEKIGVVDFKGFSENHFFQLMNIYLTEWCHRDELMWKQVYTYFYAAILVILGPYLKIFENDLPLEIKFACCIAGLALAVCVLVSGLAYEKRLSHVGRQYRTMVEMLPEEYNKNYFISKKKKEKYKAEKPAEGKKTKKDKKPELSPSEGLYMAFIIPCMMFLALIILDCFVFLFLVFPALRNAA